MPSNRLEVLISGNAKEFNDTLRGIDRQVDQTIGSLSTKAQGASLALAGMAASGGLIFKGLIDKAAEMEGFQAQLTAMMGNSDHAATELQRLAQVAATTPFELPSVVQGAINLRTMKLDVQQLLPVAGNLSILMRRDLAEGSSIFGRAMKGNRDAIHQIFDSGVLAKDSLEELGVEFKKDGSIALDSAEQLEHFQQVLVKAIQAKGDVMTAQAATINGAVSNLADTIGQIKAELGKTEAGGFQTVVRGVTDLLAQFQALSPATKGMIADTILVGTVVSGLAAVFLGLAGTLGPLVLSWQLYSQATAEAAIGQTAVADTAHLVAAAEGEATIAVEAATVANSELALATEAAAVAQGNVAATAPAAAAGTGLMASAASGLNAAWAAALSPLGLAIGAIALIAAGVALYTANLSAATQEVERETQVEAHAIKALHEKKAVVLEAADALKQYGGANKAAVDAMVADAKRLGQTDVDMTKAIAGMMVQMRQAEEAGNKEAVDRLTQRIKLLAQVRTALSGTYAAQVQAAEKSKQAEKAAASAREAVLADYQQKVQHGYFATEAEQLKSLDNVLRTIGKNHKAAADLSLDRVKLARKVAEDETKAAKDAQEERLKQQQHEADLINTTTKEGLAKRLAALQAILDSEKWTADQRRALERDVATAQQALDTKRTEEAKKAAEERQKRVKEEGVAKLKAHEAELKTASEAEAAAKERFQQGKGTAEELERQIRLHAELAAKINLEKAALEGKDKSAAARSSLRRAAEAENAAEAHKAEREIANVREEGRKKEAQHAADKASITKDAAKQEEENLKARLEAGAHVETELTAAMKKRQKSEEDALRAKAQASLQGADEAEAQKIVAEYQRDSFEMSRRHKDEETAITEELKKQKAEKDKMTDKSSPLNFNGPYGLDQLSADSSNFFKDKAKSDTPKGDPDKIRQQLEDAKRNSETAVKNLGVGAGEETNQLLKAILGKMDKPAQVRIEGGTSTDQRDWREVPPRASGQK